MTAQKTAVKETTLCLAVAALPLKIHGFAASSLKK